MKKIAAVFLALIMIVSLLPFSMAYENLPESVPSTVDKATIDRVEVMADSDGVPYFQLEIQFPKSFLDLNSECPAGGYAWIDYYWKIDDGAWEYLAGGTTDCIFDETYGFAVEGKENTYLVPDIYPEDEGSAQEIVINDHVYTIKVQLAYAYSEEGPVNFIYSQFSNEVSIGSGSFYKNVSGWAKTELQDA